VKRITHFEEQSGARVINGTTHRVVNEVRREKPSWIAREGLCNGVARKETFHKTLRSAMIGIGALKRVEVVSAYPADQWWYALLIMCNSTDDSNDALRGALGQLTSLATGDFDDAIEITSVEAQEVERYASKLPGWNDGPPKARRPIKITTVLPDDPSPYNSRWVTPRGSREDWQRLRVEKAAARK
jgi:hypothetical protein